MIGGGTERVNAWEEADNRQLTADSRRVAWQAAKKPSARSALTREGGRRCSAGIFCGMVTYRDVAAPVTSAGAPRCCASCEDSRNEGRLARRSADGRAYWGEPVVAIRLAPAGDSEELFLELPCDRSGHTLADLDVIDGADRSDFDGGADKEDFVGDVEHFARNYMFLQGNAQVFRQLRDGISRDARQNAGGERRSVKYAIVRQKNVHARAFANVALRIQSDTFGVAVETRFHSNELRVHVIRRRLGHGGESVRSDARPGANSDLNALRQSFRAKIGAPAPAGHVNVDRRVQRIHSHFAVAA